MRTLFLYLMVGVFSLTSCAHVSDKAQGLEVTNAGKEKPKYNVAKMTFAAYVDEDSVGIALKILEQFAEQKPKPDAIIIELNTPGGNMDEGFLLSKAIEDSDVPVICVVDRAAVSMGIYILQSCDVRIMTKRSSLMIHEAAIGAQFRGHEANWRSIADRLKATNAALFEHIGARMGMDPKDLAAKCVGGYQWWMVWDEALRVNAVDLVVTTVDEVTTSYRQTNVAPVNALTKADI